VTTTTHTHTSAATTTAGSIHTAAIGKDMRESAFCAELAVALKESKKVDLGQLPDQMEMPLLNRLEIGANQLLPW
jgi:hypothetical protein